LLNQLLQQIKVLQQLMQQQAVVQMQPLKGGSSAVLHISVQITKTKQQISNLQVIKYFIHVWDCALFSIDWLVASAR
jgi:hypothetical protein